MTDNTPNSKPVFPQPSCQDMSHPEPARILSRSDGASIAYRHVTCPENETSKPTVIFLHGLMSDMEGGKALELETHAQKIGYDYIRFDMFGHGQSSGAFTDGCIGRWCADTLAVIDELTDGPLILVGSSMGGWVMLHVATQLQKHGNNRIQGLIGIAPAPDFTEEYMWANMSDEQRKTLMRDGVVHLQETPDFVYPVSRNLIEDGRNQLLLTGPIAYDGPVRILQGMQDTAVEWNKALRITDALTSTDVVINFIKDGDHRLSRPQDLACLTRTVEELMRDIMTPWPEENN